MAAINFEVSVDRSDDFTGLWQGQARLRFRSVPFLVVHAQTEHDALIGILQAIAKIHADLEAVASVGLPTAFAAPSSDQTVLPRSFGPNFTQVKE